MEKAIRMAALLVMFWNLENFFYPSGAERIEDNPKVMTWKRFKAKRDLISKTIMAVRDQENQYPSLIGVCEVENLRTLRNLIYDTPLSRLGYGVIHKDSPDGRGIDVALLYRREEFYIKDTSFLRIRSFQTRDILYAKGYSAKVEDTVHVFVNHWPSKLGGEKKSLGRRMQAAKLLEAAADSILKADSDAFIIAMGDFNDSPKSAPLEHVASLINLSAKLRDSLKGSSSEIKGTHKYNGKWEMLDQFLVSGSVRGSVGILSFGHLLQDDRKYLGNKTRRTFTGPKFEGGASDHLPIVLKVEKKQ